MSKPRIIRADYYRLSNSDWLNAIAIQIDEHPGEGLARDHRAIVTFCNLNVNVLNGGFEQFFFNNGGDTGLDAVIERLDALDLAPVAILLRDAQDVYQRNREAFKPNLERGNRSDLVTEFDKLSAKFCRASGRCERAYITWMRANAASLFDGDDGRPLDPHFTGSVERHSSDGVVLETLTVKKGKPHGERREYFPDGTRLATTFYKSGTLSGDFWPDGSLKRKESTKKGLKIIEWYYPGGALHKLSVNLKSGYFAEPVRLWHENGQLAEEVFLDANGRTGAWLKFFPDGTPKLQAEYHPQPECDGLRVWNAWDRDCRQTVMDGNGVFIHDERGIDLSHGIYWGGDDDLVQRIGFRNGQRDGMTERHEKGVRVSINHYVNGVRHGEDIHYHPNGRVRTIYTWVDGKNVSERCLPQFDHPTPVVRLCLCADEKLYGFWRHVPVDEYPQALNLNEIQRELPVPPFLEAVAERNRAGLITDGLNYHNWHRYRDGINYFLTVDEAGIVTSAVGYASSMDSGGSWHLYPPYLQRLRFLPGRVRGHPLVCKVMAIVDHTFKERD